MTDTTVAPPETAVDEQDATQPPAAPDDSIVTAPATSTEPLATPEAIAVPLPPPPGPANPSPDNATLAFLQPDADGALRLWLQSIDEAADGTPRVLDLPFAPLLELDPSGDPS